MCVGLVVCSSALPARLVTARPISFARSAKLSAALPRVAVTPLPLLIVFPSSGLLRAGRPPAKCSANFGACMQRWQGGCGHGFSVGGAGACSTPPLPSPAFAGEGERSEEHTSELQSLMRISYAVFCLKNKKKTETHRNEKN